ncbi:DNA repair protein RadA [Pelagibius litoralis]|uniref:DNA repair protein RadA n=1 Tax=Pelagibius litoralis TaxID=374515 RepID=A0A967EZL3_9PROT|nr:DNA repair protein RadA [Pelagibius litoralis]NIA70313.1 DNA repair protein RadA [Pelagibius litoralis]
MAKTQSRYVCQGCGAVAGKWSGRCEGCGAWNSMTEEVLEKTPGGLSSRGKASQKLQFVDLKGQSAPQPRLVCGLAEFDRVTGGGLVPGSAVLVAGDPGIGKSTLLLQVAARLAGGGKNPASACAYISGEESIDQVRLRARRMGLAEAPVQLASATSVRDMVAGLDQQQVPAVVIVDSVQTLYIDSLESAPGTVSQVRAAAQELIRLAKKRGFSLILVGHVTKEGQIAGPKVLEHMVDTVVTFEGDRGHHFRILRASKNRFGPTDEIGVFEMTDRGLEEVANPSALFLAERRGNVAGAAVFAGLEGTRPLLVEIQALVSASPQATPRRAVVGWDSSRLAMVLAVLEARCGLALAGQEVYLNVAGGLRIGEPAADLAVAAALVSAASGQEVPEETVIFGEIGLSGEIRPVSQVELRLKEAEKLGFTRAWVAPRAKRGAGKGRLEGGGLAVEEISHLQDLVARFTKPQPRPLRAQPSAH